jgi:glycosyltransferase involved in cell wall biosynthesis
MKILFLQESDWLKRNPIIQHHLLELLSLRGHEIRVIDFELQRSQTLHRLFTRRQVFNNVTRVFANSKVTLIRPGIINFPVLDYISVLFTHKIEIDRQMQEWGPDVIVGVAILNSYWGAKAAKRAGIPFIYYWFELMHLLIPVRPFSIIGKMVEKVALRNTEKVLTITENLKQSVVNMGFDAEKIEILESGVSLDSYKLDDHGDFIRKQYGISKDDCVLLFIGLLYHFSGLKEVSLELFHQNNPRIKLLIVGEGEAYQELQKIQYKYCLSDRMILTGHKPFKDIPQYLAAADFCILPAYSNEIMRDIVPAKMYEYMAAGKPVISTELQGILNKFGRDNGVVYVHRPEDVIKKAIELIDNDEYNDLSIRTRKFVEKYSWNNIADRFEKILQESIIKKGRNSLT